MGLPGSGKTTLAEKLVSKLGAAWFNADAVRQDIYSELGFSEEDRIAHAKRMENFVIGQEWGGLMLLQTLFAQQKKPRDAFNADFVVWVDRIMEGRYEDTNKMFQRPMNYDVRLTDGTADEWVNQVMEKLEETETWDNQAPTALLIGRYQPFHIGHKTLVAEAIKRTGQCCIALRDVGGIDESNPYDFEKVKKEIYSACREFGNKIKSY